MEAIESAPRNLFESPTNPPQPPATHSVVSAADSSELKCSCGWTFRPRKSGSLAQGPGKQSEAAWSRHTAVVSADYADYEYSEKVFSMVQNATEAKSGGQTQKIVEAYSVLWKTFFDCVVRWKREFAEEVPRPHLLKQSVEIFVQLATMNFRVSFAEMQQLRGFLPYNEVPLLRQLHLKSPYGAFRLTTQDTSASIRAQLSGQPENEGLPLYIMLEGVKDLPPMPANVTAQTEMEAVRKEHTSLLLRDSQTVKELERRLCELEFLCERLEQLERSPNAGVYKGRKGDGIETIADYKDLIKLDMDQLAEELDNLIDSEEAEEHKSDKDGTFVDDRSRPASASNGKSSASSAKQGRSREKRKTRKTEKAEESEKYEDYERYDEDDDDDEEVVKPEKKAKSPRTPKQSSKAKSPASAPPVHHPGATKPATGLGVRRTEYTAYEPKGTPAAAGPVSMPNQGDRQMLSKLAQESMSAGKQGARAPEEEAVAAPSLYAARGIVFHRGGTAGIYYHLTGYAALFAVLFRHSSITADNPLRSGLEESMRPWRFDFNAPDDLLRRVYSSEPPNSGPLARPNGAPFQYLRGKAEVEEVVSELLRRLPIALLQAVYDLLSNPALAPFFASWDPLVQEYAEYFHVRLWVDLRHLHKPCFHVYARNQVEMAMRLLQQGHDIGLLLFTDQKPARVASYDCVGDLRRAAPWSRQCEACEMLGRYLGSLQQQQQDPTAQHR